MMSDQYPVHRIERWVGDDGPERDAAERPWCGEPSRAAIKTEDPTCVTCKVCLEKSPPMTPSQLEAARNLLMAGSAEAELASLMGPDMAEALRTLLSATAPPSEEGLAEEARREGRKA
jgi:hypothetical protein